MAIKYILQSIIELIGTFMLCFIGGLAVINGSSLATVALAHGFTLFAMVCWGGKVSGGQFNPAVTVSLLCSQDIKPIKGAIYMVAQLAGSVLAGVVIRIVNPNKKAGSSPSLTTGVTAGQGLLMEFFATFMLITAIHFCVRNNISLPVTAALVGTVVIADISAIGPFTGASMNPARTFGPYLIHTGTLLDSKFQPIQVYYLPQLLAGVVGGLLNKYVTYSDMLKDDVDATDQDKTSDLETEIM